MVQISVTDLMVKCSYNFHPQYAEVSELLANNHILDRDYEGMITTADNVEARGFDFGGVSRTAQEKEKPIIVEVRGIRAGFLCFTDTMNRDSSCKTEEEAKTKAALYGVKTLKNMDCRKEVKKLRDAGARRAYR